MLNKNFLNRDHIVHRLTYRQVNSNTFPSHRCSHLFHTPLPEMTVIKGIFAKPYKSYKKIMEVFSSYVYLHQMKDYYVAYGRILDLELNNLVFMSPRKLVMDIDRNYIPEFIDIYIAKEFMEDDKVMKEFNELFQKGYNFNYIILPKEDLNNLLIRKADIDKDLIPLTYEQQKQKEGA